MSVSGPSRSSRTLAFIRDADWLNGERARIYSTMIAAALAVLFAWILFAALTIYHNAQAFGSDFTSFYAASKLAISGHAADAWRPDIHGTVEAHLFNTRQGYLAFFYPPPYLLICWPLALLPYPVALIVWTTATLSAAVVAIRLFFRETNPHIQIGLIALLAFPGVWINLGCGQNGALILAVLALGFAWLDRRPVLAGLVLGALVIKPQLAIVLPFVLAASGRWRTFFATGVSAAVLCLLAFVAVGVDGYAAFFANSTYARESLNRGLVDPALMQSLYAALRVLKTPMTIAYIAQGLLSAGVIASVSYIARRYKPDGPALGALCVAATVLATPFMLDYDLLICALPMGWLILRGGQNGFRPWEKLVLLLVFLLPLISRKLAQVWHLPIAPLVLLALFAIIVTRLRAQASAVSPVHPSQMPPAEVRP